MELEQFRQEIDRIDSELTKLFVALVGAYKKEHHMEVFDPRRERLVLDKIANLAVDKELAPYLQRIYHCIMDESKNYERTYME